MSAAVTFDAVVAGAGPAGATASLCLARGGASVALVDPFTEGALRVGETLAPLTREPLTWLGLWDRFLAAGHRPAHAIRSAWGSAEPIDQDYILHPYGNGWHVDRRAFDRMLVDAASAAGARLIRGMIAKFSRCGDVWALQAAGVEIKARYVVDATGRSACFARRLGARRVALDRLVGVVASLPPEQTTSAHEGATLVEAVSDGWWYSARTPNGCLLLAYMTDADLWARAARSRDAFAAKLVSAQLTRERVRSAPGAPSRVVAAVSAQLRPTLGCGWIATGDAAMATDPLAGNGVCLALRSGIRTVSAVLRELDGDHDAIREYAADVTRAFSTYTTEWRWFYGCERRFASSEFWRRRAPTDNR